MLVAVIWLLWTSALTLAVRLGTSVLTGVVAITLALPAWNLAADSGVVGGVFPSECRGWDTYVAEWDRVRVELEQLSDDMRDTFRPSSSDYRDWFRRRESMIRILEPLEPPPAIRDFHYNTLEWMRLARDGTLELALDPASSQANVLFDRVDELQAREDALLAKANAACAGSTGT